MKRILLLVAWGFWFNALFAQPVNVKEARTFARAFVSNKTKNFTVGSVIYSRTIANSQSPAFYVFTIRPKGFIIVSADKRVKPVLAYSFTSGFDPAHIIDPVKDALNAYQKNISKIVSGNHALSLDSYWDVSKLSARKGSKAVQPLVTTRWGQRPYYNYLCPDNCPTGCVTTATAQIMKYYNHPARGNGYHAYQSDQYGTQSANFGATTYRWNDMPNTLSSSTPSSEVLAVAQLMYHIAVALEVDFTPDESNTYPNKVADILSEYFSYSSQAEFIKRSNYTVSTWNNLLKNELDNQRVVLYTGFCSEENVGHAFVMDGYDDYGKYHINWGWDGWYDGYFEINDLTPVSGYSFNETQGAVIKIIPVDTYTDVKLFGDLQLSSQTLNYNDEFLVGADIANYGNIQFYGDFKASLFDTNDVFVTDIEVLENQSINAQDYASLTFYTSNLGVVPGVYKLGIYFRNQGEENWMLVDEDEYSNPITISVNSDSTQTLLTASNILVNPDPVQESEPVSIEFDLENTDSDYFLGQIGVWLHELNGDLVYELKDTLVYIGAGSTANFVFNDTIADVMGTYKLVLWYKPQDSTDWKPIGSAAFPNFKQIDVVLPDAFSLPPDSFENNNHLDEAYLIPQNWDNDLATFSTGYANIHSAYGDSADYYAFKLAPGYNYSIYAYVLDSYVDSNYTNDVIFKVKLSTDTAWSVYYDDDDMGVIDFDNMSDTTMFYVCVNPFFVGNLGTYELNLMIERQLITDLPLANAEPLSIYPNPARDFITISGDFQENDVVTIYDMQGKKLREVSYGNGTISLDNLSVGTYLLTIVRGNHTFSTKFVKE